VSWASNGQATAAAETAFCGEEKTTAWLKGLADATAHQLGLVAGGHQGVDAFGKGGSEKAGNVDRFRQGSGGDQKPPGRARGADLLSLGMGEAGQRLARVVGGGHGEREVTRPVHEAVGQVDLAA